MGNRRLPLQHVIVGLTALALLNLFAGCVDLSIDAAPQVREYTLEAKETQVELYPGKTVSMWTFNDVVPGPLIRATEGDRVIIHFYNNHTLPHNVHFHGAHPVDMDGVVEIAPGGSFTYDFIAGPAGAFVYHCHVETRIHIQKGLYGQFIVDPKAGWNAAKPEREHFVIFSDWNPSLNATPEAYTINGKSFPSTIPFDVELGQAARFYVSSMSMIPVAAHFHGTLSKQIWPYAQPLDIMTLAPGETRVIDYSSDYAGVWMFHDHYEDHLVTDGVYPGGTIGLIRVGPDAWTNDQDVHGHEDPGAASGDEGSVVDSDHVVDARDYEFSPDRITVKVGATVTWQNGDPVPHTVTSDAGAVLNSGDFGKGRTFSFTFTEPGTYSYHCVPHSGQVDGEYVGMVGVVVVEA